MDRYFLTPSRRDTENITLADGNRSSVKENLQSNRKHNNKKQAFGELKNIIHSIVPKGENINDRKLPIQEKPNNKPCLSASKFKIRKNLIPQDSGKNANLDQVKDKKVQQQWEDFKYDYACSLPDEDAFKAPQSVWMEDICSKISDQLSNVALKQSQPKTADDIQKIIDYEFGYENELHFSPINEIDICSFEINESPKKLSLPILEDLKLSSFDDLELSSLDDLI